MGDPVGPQYVPGDLCTHCWGLGKAFGDFPTPWKVFIEWEGLVGPLLGANKIYVGTQNPVIPCQYTFNDGTFSGFWNYNPATADAQVWLNLNPGTFVFLFGPLCTLSMTNGVATVTIS